MTLSTLIDRIAAGRTDLVFELPAGAGASQLQWCAYYGDVSALRHLLAHGASLQQLGSDLGLNGAAFHGHWQLCQFLLEHGASATAALPDTGETPLHAALCNDDRTRYDAVIKVLLQHGADVHAATIAGVATGAFMRDCRTKGETPLHRAAACGGAATIQMLLDAGARPETPDAHGDSALAWASWYRRPADILRLLCYGAHRIHPARQPLRANLVGGPR